jgi:hypothetical protein
VSIIVGIGVDIDFDELDTGVTAVLGDPICGDENVFGCHFGRSFLSITPVRGKDVAGVI